MAEKFYGNLLDAEDTEVFLRMKRWFLTMLPPTPPGRSSDEPSEGPYVRVVLTPVGGIPAMWEENSAVTGTGTQGDSSAGTGTGTNIGDEGDRPGYADCQVYGLAYTRGGKKPLAHPRLQPMGFSVTVFNPTFTAVNGNQFVTAIRDDDGNWWVPSLGLLFEDCV